MKTALLALLVMACCFSMAAQNVKDASHLTPNGKGWGEDRDDAPPEAKPFSVTTGNGISYHGGPVMSANPVPVYFIWYGNWNSTGSNSASTVNLIENYLYSSSGLNHSGYENINTTYGDTSSNVSGGVLFNTGNDWFPGYTNGTRLRDSSIQSIVSSYIQTKQGGAGDTSGVYFVLTSSDVNETSGFCTKYCGWHTRATIGGRDIKYAFVGNPDRCPNACEAQTTSPNGNSGADGMASIMAHETEEAISDPDLNAWYDSSGQENADKCAWKWGPTTGTVGSGGYNQFLAGKNWLIQMNWENARGGGCDQTLGGNFYTQ